MQYKFSEKEIRELLKKIVIIVDTRENANSHIIDWFTNNKVPFKIQKLDAGDYSCYLPAGSFKGHQRDIYFTNDIVIERKNSIDEIAMNLKDNKTNINQLNNDIVKAFGERYLEKVLKTDYNRLKYEFTNLNKNDVKFYIFLEDHLYDKHIRNNDYRSAYEPATLYRRIKGLEAEFNTVIRPIAKEFIAAEIYSTLRMNVRNTLVHKGFIEGEENAFLK